MIVEPIEQDDDKPFVKITFTKQETKMLTELVRYDIELLVNSYKSKLNLPAESNRTFALPLYNKLREVIKNERL